MRQLLFKIWMWVFQTIQFEPSEASFGRVVWEAAMEADSMTAELITCEPDSRIE